VHATDRTTAQREQRDGDHDHQNHGRVEPRHPYIQQDKHLSGALAA
jgi:hypothetical protein